MKIGITGHQERDGIDWAWVRLQLGRQLASKAEITGFSSLAAGTDQLFAETVLKRGGKLTAVIPIEDYASYFKGEALERYMQLLTLANVINLNSNKTDVLAFLDAGKWIVRKADQIIAVWDGEQAEGTGGTGDIVAYAASIGKPIVHINPIELNVSYL